VTLGTLLTLIEFRSLWRKLKLYANFSQLIYYA
jgi:hypothetical protein